MRHWCLANGGELWAAGELGTGLADSVVLQWRCYSTMPPAASRVLSWGNGCARFRPGSLWHVEILLTRTPAQHKWYQLRTPIKPSSIRHQATHISPVSQVLSWSCGLRERLWWVLNRESQA